MSPHGSPDRTWQKVGLDLFVISGNVYLVIVDYYSKYPEVALLCDKTASTVVMHFKNVCARQGASNRQHAIPEQGIPQIRDGMGN
jgi:hypothetical protein